jgi:anti-sigma B factor antagonist
VDGPTTPPGAPFSVLLRKMRGVPVVEVSGEVCFSTAAKFRAALAVATTTAAGEPAPAVVVDLAEVGFMDSEGIKVLVWAVEELREFGGDLCLVARERPVRRILEITGLDRALRVYPDTPSALKDLKEGGPL